VAFVHDIDEPPGFVVVQTFLIRLRVRTLGRASLDQAIEEFVLQRLLCATGFVPGGTATLALRLARFRRGPCA
jgi:hypothetical protein